MSILSRREFLVSWVSAAAGMVAGRIAGGSAPIPKPAGTKGIDDPNDAVMGDPSPYFVCSTGRLFPRSDDELIFSWGLHDYETEE